MIVISAVLAGSTRQESDNAYCWGEVFRIKHSRALDSLEKPEGRYVARFVRFAKGLAGVVNVICRLEGECNG